MTRLLFLLVPVAIQAQTADDFLKRGRAQLDSGKADDAVTLLEKAVKLAPQNAAAHLQLGNALGTVAQKANVFRQPMLARRVKSEFETAATLDPSLVDAHNGLMQFYLQAPGVMGGSVAKARSEAAAIARLNPLRGHLADANIAQHEKDSVSAERSYRAAATESPDSLVAVTAWLNYLNGRGRPDETFAPIDQYLARHPDDRAMLFYLGRAAAITGTRLDRGEQALRAVLKSPNPPSGPRVAAEAVHLRLGDILAKRGDKSAARAEYEEALKINPKFEQAKKALSAL